MVCAALGKFEKKERTRKERGKKNARIGHEKRKEEKGGMTKEEERVMYRTSGVIFFIDYCTAIRDT
jgi:hypothetical protein